MTTIPEIRTRLHELSTIHGIPELAVLAEATRRRSHGRKGRVVSREVTPALEAEVRDYAKLHKEESMHVIGQRFGINQGRVSEILFGKRH